MFNLRIAHTRAAGKRQGPLLRILAGIGIVLTVGIYAGYRKKAGGVFNGMINEVARNNAIIGRAGHEIQRICPVSATFFHIPVSGGSDGIAVP